GRPPAGALRRGAAGVLNSGPPSAVGGTRHDAAVGTEGAAQTGRGGRAAARRRAFRLLDAGTAGHMTYARTATRGLRGRPMLILVSRPCHTPATPPATPPATGCNRGVQQGVQQGVAPPLTCDSLPQAPAVAPQGCNGRPERT